MGYVRLYPRRWPHKQDEQKRQKFPKEVVILSAKPKVDLWYCDESGFEGKPRARKVWALRDSHPVISYTGRHIRSSVIVAVRPRDGKLVSLIMPFVNSYTFQMFIEKIHRHINCEKRNIIILDNATWHKTKRLSWGKLKPLYLPSYSPDLNPIEELWLVIKNTYFSWFKADNHEQLDDRLELALKYYIDNPNIVKSICIA